MKTQVKYQTPINIYSAKMTHSVDIAVATCARILEESVINAGKIHGNSVTETSFRDFFGAPPHVCAGIWLCIEDTLSNSRSPTHLL